MKRPPRARNLSMLSQRLLLRVAFSATLLLLGVLFIEAVEISDGDSAKRDQTMTFISFVFLDLTNALQNRGLHVPLLRGRVNKMLLLTASGSFAVALALVYLPLLQSVFQTEALGAHDLAVLVILALCSASAHEARRRWERRKADDEMWASQQAV